MSTLNKVILIGALGEDPRFWLTAKGTPACRLHVATDHPHRPKSVATKQVGVEWHLVTCWDDLAINCAKHLYKGRDVMVEGHIVSRTWVSHTGDRMAQVTIVAEKVGFLRGGEKQPIRATPQVSAPPDDMPAEVDGAPKQE